MGLKGKNLLPVGANSFLLEKTLFLFRRGLVYGGAKQEVTIVVSLISNGRIYTKSIWYP